ncbi:hypothetical protein MBT84_01410 [Streptomyces sp. MBT84]|uniref:hypothetical protein n=1 Tax=Streptomyces sp. MBT84 TaxID=1488414 RepID=UPI001C6E5D93|nr:hypothetical protein [Streptomyces sp. MBT84]MBW8698221.1 hypothetical protein [Streptomyces sp. MBT84]
MLISTYRKRVMGCRPRRRHLDMLAAEAIQDVTAPLASWTASGSTFTAQSDDLDALDALVRDRKIITLTLEVAEAAAPGTPVVKVEFGSFQKDLRGAFLGLFVTNEASWDTHVYLQGERSVDIEDKARRVVKILDKSRILNKHTDLLYVTQLGLQSWMLWSLIKIVPGHYNDDYEFVSAIFVATAFLMVPHALSHAVMAFKTRLAQPSPTGWWATFASSPSTGPVLGLLGLLVAVASVVLDSIRG